MGKRRAKHPFENNPFTDAFLEWMGSSEGEHSVYALDLVFAALENADVDPRRRKIVWGRRETAVDRAVGRTHPCRASGRAARLDRNSRGGWLEGFAPESYSERQLEELDRLTEQWLDDYERKSQAARK